MTEIWRDIPHYEGLYEVSSLGRIRNKQGRLITLYPSRYHISPNGTTYYSVHLHINGKSRSEWVHRLVGLAFIPNPNNYKYINHKDEDKGNNEVSNLEWCTCKYNNNYGSAKEWRLQTCRERGVYKKTSERMKGDNNPAHTHRESNNFVKDPGRKPVRCVETGVVYESAVKASELTGIRRTSISQVCGGKTRLKTAGGFHWEFEI